jgi:hypothetical protein
MMLVLLVFLGTAPTSCSTNAENTGSLFEMNKLPTHEKVHSSTYKDQRNINSLLALLLVLLLLLLTRRRTRRENNGCVVVVQGVPSIPC